MSSVERATFRNARKKEVLFRNCLNLNDIAIVDTSIYSLLTLNGKQMIQLLGVVIELSG